MRNRASRLSGWPEGYDRAILSEVDSTMSEAARRAPLLAGPEWIFAQHQTAARGRRGRAWSMPAGNFAATLVMPLSEPPERMALRSFVASLALFDALAEVTGAEAALSLKWPNDVLLTGGKLAGILLESLPGGALAIGVGVNLIAAPESSVLEPGAVMPVTLLAETGVRVTPERLLDALAAAYALREASFVTYGFGPTRSDWLARAARLGEEIIARTTRTAHRGLFETVDDAGRLVLHTSEGARSIAAADVFF